MQKVDLIVCGDYVLTMNEKLEVISSGAVVIHDKKIIDVDTADAIFKRYSSEKIIEGKGRAVLPGLVNTHTHAAMVLFRGLVDDLLLNDWLKKYIWPAENKFLSPEFIHDAIELACLEMLKAGITTYNDMYFYGDAAAQATKKMGMRAVLGSGIVDFPTATAKTADEYLEKAARFINSWNEDELIIPAIAPHSIYACSPETLKKSKAIADKYGNLLHIHLSETEWEVGEVMSLYGKKPVKHLEAIGFLEGRVLAAHCVWVDDDEIELLARRNVSVSHCMESNLKLSSGFAPVVTMLMSGVKVTFGTDGAASNNDLNILSEMATTAKVHKALANDPTILDAKTVVLMATRWGAEALGLGEKVGSIERGKTADIITINFQKPHLTPLYDVYSHMVYAAMASDVETVIVNGRVIIDNRVLTTGSEDEILQKASEWGKQIALYKTQL
ncbi:MAG: S-adenosylhomocysteine deaminase [Thermodesulfovibrio sp.]|nr:S-adenosylhomocysteine deaminase [Thermodesulfovibrio sp.]